MKKTEDKFKDAMQKEKQKLYKIKKTSEENKNLICDLEKNILELHDEKHQLNDRLKILINQVHLPG